MERTLQSQPLSTRSCVWALGAALVIAVSCSSSTGPSPASGPSDTAAEAGASEADVPAGEFSSRQAWADLLALVALGPRPAESRAADEARALIRTQLEAMGAEVSVIHPEARIGERVVEIDHLKGVLPGASDDIVLLMAHYDSFPASPGANIGASGPAAVLGIGRALAARERPYTVWLVFVEGDGMRSASGDLLFAGSQTVLGELAAARIRLAVSFGGVADAELRVARDLNSHRSYRQMFWRSAKDLGFTEAFVPDAGFESVISGHRVLIGAGLTRTVGLHDSLYGIGESPGSLWASKDDTPEHCSQASLEAVGRVALEAIRRVVERVAKIDRYAQRPFISATDEAQAGSAGFTEAPPEAAAGALSP